MNESEIITDCKSDPEFIEKLNTITVGKSINAEQRSQLLAVIANKADAFKWNSDELGRTTLVEHTIPTGDHKPVQQKQYPIPSIARDHLREQVADMLSKGIIRPSSSPWRSPVLLAKRLLPDGKVTYRFCIDLKKVNDVTTKDSYSLPRISETADCLSGAKFFSTLDIDRAFWQVGIAEEDKCKTAFVVEGKLFEFNVMPFGSMNAPSTFQRLMDRVLRGLTWSQCLVYIDDVLIFSNTFEKHLKDIDLILDRIISAGMKLKPTKCLFANDEVNYLGFKISRNGIQVSDSKVNAIISVPPPDRPKKLFSFLCSINYYRTLIPKFGDRTAELYMMAESKKKSLVWDTKSLKLFTDLKQALVSAPILVFPNYNLPFCMQTDASGFGISGVLLQKINGLFRPVAFASRKLTAVETRYSTTERELLAIVYAYKQFFHQIYGRKIIIYTDHQPLVTMQKLKNPMGRLGRLFHKLQDVDYEFVYVPGEKNFLPDFLSRSFEVESNVCLLNQSVLKSTIDWKTEQSRDRELSEVKKLVESNGSDSKWLNLNNGKRWLQNRKYLYVSGDILYHSNCKIVCPDALKSVVLKMFHDSPFAGHRAFKTTFEALRARYFWLSMPRDVEDYCRSCIECQKFNYSCFHNCAPLKPLVVARPFQLIGIDIMGPFHESLQGNKYIILAIDHHTKFSIGAAIHSFTAEITAVFVFNEIICKFGMVEQFLTDQGVNFESNLLKHLCILLGTDKLHTSTYHAAGNGITERLNKSIKPNIAKYVNDSHDDWDLFLPLAISAYNNSHHSSIRMTPFEALFGRKSVLVADVIMNHQLPPNTRLRDVSDFTFALRRSADYISSVINENSRVAQAKQKAQYDKFVKDRAAFKVGDLVKINNCRRRVGSSKAFEPKFIGPYKIAKILGDLNYLLESPCLPQEIVHYNRLSRFYDRDPEFINLSKSFTKPYLTPSFSSSPSRPPNSSNSVVVFCKKRGRPRVNLAQESNTNQQQAEIVETLPQLELPLIRVNDAEQETNEVQNYDKAEVVMNTKGKPTAKCGKCGERYEAKTGLRIHMASCSKKK